MRYDSRDSPVHEECLRASHSRVIVGQGRVGEDGGGRVGEEGGGKERR